MFLPAHYNKKYIPDSTTLEIIESYTAVTPSLKLPKQASPIQTPVAPRTVRIVEQPTTPAVPAMDEGELLQCTSQYKQDHVLFLKVRRVLEERMRSRSCCGKVPESLVFDADFESSNLKEAVELEPGVFQLYLHYDTNSERHTQWFYFRVKSVRPWEKAKFVIANLAKPGTLYDKGLKPFVWEDGRWSNNVSETVYRKTEDNSHSLSFEYVFKSPEFVYFAYSQPYTYSDLQKDLAEFSALNSAYLKVDTLCHSLAGNPVYVLTLTENAASIAVNGSVKQTQQDSCPHKHKKAVFLTARVHAGETVSSFMIRGTLKFLLADSSEARALLTKYIFVVVPMLNPDGVIYGNSRCSLLGVDLNRRWKDPSHVMHPSIYYTKQLLQRVAAERPVAMFCDMHGHSLKLDAFMYGCAVRSTELKQLRRNFAAKLIPFLFCQQTKLFSFPSSSFRLERAKQHTARIVVYQELEVTNSYTLEASFYSATHPEALQNPANAQINPQDLEYLGKQLLIAFASTRENVKRQQWGLWWYLRYGKLPVKTASEVPQNGLNEDQLRQAAAEEDPESGGSNPSCSDEEIEPPKQQTLRVRTRLATTLVPRSRQVSPLQSQRESRGPLKPLPPLRPKTPAQPGQLARASQVITHRKSITVCKERVAINISTWTPTCPLAFNSPRPTFRAKTRQDARLNFNGGLRLNKRFIS